MNSATAPVETWTVVQSGIQVEASILRTQATGSPSPLREGDLVIHGMDAFGAWRNLPAIYALR